MAQPKRFLLLLLTGLFSQVAAAAPTYLSGQIEGAEYGIYLPETPNGKVLILAHGYWPESMPNTLNEAWLFGVPEELLAEGWIVATSAYRRNGWLMEEAARDLENLYEVIAAAMHGAPGTIYLMGESMGGGIATLLAERPGSPFGGVLAMGAYLFGPIGGEASDAMELGAHFSRSPQIPILYLTNESELEGPDRYVSAAAGGPVAPVLWTVARSGHVNLNRKEQRLALDALVAWVESGEIPESREATILMQPESTAVFGANEARGSVIRMVPVFGNFITSFVREDFESLGIQLGDRFTLKVADEELTVLMGETYTDVPVGEWVGFWDANGNLLICRNYRNAVQTLGLEGEPTVAVRPSH